MLTLLVVEGVAEALDVVDEIRLLFVGEPVDACILLFVVGMLCWVVLADSAIALVVDDTGVVDNALTLLDTVGFEVLLLSPSSVVVVVTVIGTFEFVRAAVDIVGTVWLSSPLATTKNIQNIKSLGVEYIFLQKKNSPKLQIRNS
jgi:hypothetical protein